MTEQWDSGAAGHEPFLEFQVGDAAFVDAGVERGGDALHDCGLVFADGLGQAGQGREAGGCEVLEPVREAACVAGVEHGGELTHQVVGSVQFRAVLEQPPECLCGVQAAPGWRGGDPAGDLTGRGRSLSRRADRQTAPQRCDGHLDPLVVTAVALGDDFLVQHRGGVLAFLPALPQVIQVWVEAGRPARP
ncbi:hypothetical protein ACIOWI_37175, partial [Streptomyces sp. NPDC087659]|uniref:hypothetical protein n=1 Tax=Streptomyces sp. NPDC087659 TaxID=3365801 RepID=UPI00381F9595